MLDIAFIREHPERIKAALEKRSVVFDVDYLLEQDAKRRAKIKAVDDMRQEHNRVSDVIATLGGAAKAEHVAAMKELKVKLADCEFELKTLEEEFTALMYQIPNLPFDDVPVGPDERANVVLREAGEKPQFGFRPRDYMELGEKLDLIDTERAAKVSGSRFGYLKHEAALLEFAIVQFVFSRLTNPGWLSIVIEKNNLAVPSKAFIPLVPPVLIRPEVFRAMGKLDPGQEEERYFLSQDNLYLVGSAEHSTGPLYRDEILAEDILPHRHIAFSTCFRREAGSYGKDTRGIMRVHQFDKLEMFAFAHPEHSRTEHDFFLAVQEALVGELGLAYRVLVIATGDMVWTDAKQYDIETWLPGSQGGEYRETHSTSHSTDFQSRRLNAKFREANGQSSFVHTINGTAFAIGRSLIAILENYQQEDGSVRVPDALMPYMHGITVIRH